MKGLQMADRACKSSHTLVPSSNASASETRAVEDRLALTIVMHGFPLRTLPPAASPGGSAGTRRPASDPVWVPWDKIHAVHGFAVPARRILGQPRYPPPCGVGATVRGAVQQT